MTGKSTIRGDRAEVWVTQDRINIGSPVYEQMGKPARILVFFDRAQATFMLTPVRHDTNSGRKVSPMRDRHAVAVSMNDHSYPFGRYLPIGGGVFIHESRQR